MHPDGAGCEDGHWASGRHYRFGMLVEVVTVPRRSCSLIGEMDFAVKFVTRIGLSTGFKKVSDLLNDQAVALSLT